MTSVVRLAEWAELPAVLRLERESETAPHWPLAEYEAMLSGGRGDQVRRCLYVVLRGDEVVGFAVGRVAGPGPGAEAEVESIAVARDQRRVGAGTALLRAVLGWCGEQGADEVGLEVRAGSEGALRMYAGSGFAVTGRRRGYYRDPAEDAVLMRCALRGAGAATLHV